MSDRLLPLLAGLALGGAIGMAHADQFPRRGHYDSRMRTVAYNPGQVVHLSTRIGATLVVGFSEKEKVSAVAETDTLHLASIPKGNYLFFKPSAALALQPVVVLTTLPDGRMRRYVFEIKTVTTPTMANGADGIYYSVQFVYPREVAAAQVAEQTAAEKVQAAAAQTAEQKAAETLLREEASDPGAPIEQRNWRYVAQGDRSLTPVAVFDDGYSTVFRFPRNERIPAIFVVNPDGKEAVAPSSVSGSLVTVGVTAREFRLRDGDTVLDVYNLGYTTMGTNPDTGTVSAVVQRLVKRELAP
ncbi:MAG: TrbG/VirB9 family P-type conjugative transfer protein [Betaproteobacteria bacterium]|nr:TrbG/VirB9 family P-type conjugative transfer protein [Betaproteobacteria bacterium]